MGKRPRLSDIEISIIAERYAIYVANRPKVIARDFKIPKHRVEYYGKKALNANSTPPLPKQESNPDSLREGHRGSEAPMGPRMDRTDS